MPFLSYLFDPTPSRPTYADIQLMPFVFLSAGLLIASFFLSRWRKSTSNAVTKKLSKSWPTAAFLFGFSGIILVVSRAEGIQYLAMRFLWIVWAALALLYVVLQYRVFQARHYEVVKSDRVEDPREKYLPRRKR